MPPWLEILLAVCVVAITVALVAALFAVRQATRRTDRVLAVVEEELRPLVGQLEGLTDEVRRLVRQASEELERVGGVIQRVHDVSDGIGRVLTAVAGLTRAGQLIGVAAGVKRGLDVFVNRLRRHRGDHHG